MLKHLPGADPAPDRATLPATEGRTGKHALLGWLSDFRLEPFPKASRVRRRVLLPMVAAALISTTTVAACGSEETVPEPAEERPAAQTTDRTDQGSSGSGTQNVAANAATPTNSRQSANADSAGAGGSTTPPQASRAEPTGAPTTPAASEQSGQAEQPAPTGEQLERAEDLYLEAELYLLNQRFHRAAHSLDQAIAINPNLAEAYTLRGFTRTMLRDHDGAMQDFEKALAMGAENAGRAYAFRSYTHSEMGNYDDALADAETAREMIHHEDQFARADADLAQFTALYRSGDYATIDTYSLQRLPQGSTHELNQNLAPYGLVKLYEHLDVTPEHRYHPRSGHASPPQPRRRQFPPQPVPRPPRPAVAQKSPGGPEQDHRTNRRGPQGQPLRPEGEDMGPDRRLRIHRPARGGPRTQARHRGWSPAGNRLLEPRRRSKGDRHHQRVRLQRPHGALLLGRALSTHKRQRPQLELLQRHHGTPGNQRSAPCRPGAARRRPEVPEHTRLQRQDHRRRR